MRDESAFTISLAAEIAAFSNSNGGKIFIGVADNGNITGLTREDINRINQLISNAASQLINPPINPVTENVLVNNQLIIIVTIAEGISKTYVDNNGAIWVKSGADKRKVTSREEMQRIFQSSGLVYADEVEVSGSSITDLDLNYFSEFYQKIFEDDLVSQELPLIQLLNNMNLAKGDRLNLTGLLIFGKNLQLRRPAFMIKAVAYPGDDIASYATKVLPYRGLGNGIRRALREYPHISFEDDREGNLFKVIIQRRL